MEFCRLRKRHPAFIYHSFQVRQKNKKLRIQFRFLLKPNIEFAPILVIPFKNSLPQEQLENFIFHLGLIEMISYWKAACSPEIIIKAGCLSSRQIKWWKDLFIHGLGEFFYQNKINPSRKDLLNIRCEKPKRKIKSKFKLNKREGNLILVGGGRDSAVSLELLKKLESRQGSLIFKTTTTSTTIIKPAGKIIKAAGFPPPLIASRIIDPRLLQLNKQGYLNGHTPFSAYLAFLGVFIAAMHSFKRVIVANERSADEKNLTYHSLKINHQYSKSFRFERLFRQYTRQYLTPQIEYFSFLRPLYELQISKLFSGFPQYHSLFLSCNPGQKTGYWCGKCAKCAFVYLSLAPFLSPKKMKKIFGQNYFYRPEIISHLEKLVGLKKHKPFDCVGTEKEAILALGLTLEKHRLNNNPIPPALLALARKLKLNQKRIKNLKKKILSGWNKKNFLSTRHVKILKEALKNNGN